jgi:outer membrane autotransporter protein
MLCLSARTVGGAAGLDYHLTPDTVLGFALAGGGTNWNLSQGLGSGKSDAFQAGLYGTTRWGPTYLAAAFAFTNHWMSTDRTAVGDHLTADFNAQSYGGRLEGGYRFATLYGAFAPYAAIQAQSTRRATPKLTPSPTALRSPSLRVTRTIPGASLVRATTSKCCSITARCSSGGPGWRGRTTGSAIRT